LGFFHDAIELITSSLVFFLIEDYLADLALQAHQAWQALEKDSAESLVLMTGLLNFGDPKASGPEVKKRAGEIQKCL